MPSVTDLDLTRNLTCLIAHIFIVQGRKTNYWTKSQILELRKPKILCKGRYSVSVIGTGKAHSGAFVMRYLRVDDSVANSSIELDPEGVTPGKEDHWMKCTRQLRVCEGESRPRRGEILLI